MPGLDPDVSASPLPDRGLRSPNHIGYVASHAVQNVYPFMAAPVRPGESLVGLSLRGDTILRSLTNVPQSPFCYAEVAYWYVPLSALDNFFVEMYKASGEDKVETGTTTLGNPTSSILNAPNPVSGHGHLTPGLQAQVREWAGEIGGNSGDDRVQGSEYLPIVSWATWKVATDWYDLGDVGSRFGVANPGLFDSPPFVERWIRSATASHFTLGAGAVDDIANGGTDNINNLSQIVEKMFLLAQPEMTYPEILANAGVDVNRNLGGLAQPLMISQKRMRYGDTNPMFAKLDTDGNRVSTGNDFSGAFTQYGNVPGDPTQAAFMWQRGAVGHLSANWNENRRRNMFITEPGIILGTVCWYSILGIDSEYAHMFDVTRMTGPGQWGRPSPGGVDEEDFIKRDLLYDRAGTALQGGDDQGQASGNQTGDAVLNMLNLYINGDIASVGFAGSSNPETEYRLYDPMGAELTGDNLDANTRTSTQLHVLSDLVA